MVYQASISFRSAGFIMRHGIFRFPLGRFPYGGFRLFLTAFSNVSSPNSPTIFDKANKAFGYGRRIIFTWSKTICWQYLAGKVDFESEKYGYSCWLELVDFWIFGPEIRKNGSELAKTWVLWEFWSNTDANRVIFEFFFSRWASTSRSTNGRAAKKLATVRCGFERRRSSSTTANGSAKLRRRTSRRRTHWRRHPSVSLFEVSKDPRIMQQKSSMSMIFWREREIRKIKPKIIASLKSTW